MFEALSGTTRDAELFKADLVIGADVINFIARLLLTGQPDVLRDTRDVAHRIFISGEKPPADLELAGLTTDPCTTSWCGQETHLVDYPIRNGGLYDIVSDNCELCNCFGKWERRMQKPCALVGDFMKWRLCDLPNLTLWAHPRGQGRHARRQLPPGAAVPGAGAPRSRSSMSRRCANASPLDLDMRDALKRYEEIRMPRASLVRARAREHQHILHIEDSMEQGSGTSGCMPTPPRTSIFWPMTSAGSGSSLRMLRSLVWREPDIAYNGGGGA
ncbi:hypothetical protein DL768_008605 [Monosporascus sp. mg162]|nr:hypothetical protein DL768_008605 [Monosporascus sp. mg162]